MRDLSDSEADALGPGADHYRAYVGPPDQYDLIGASQFALLIALGLRGRHRLLDFGCGSLRAGRLLIPYLDAGNYYGIEPNEWLVEAGLRRQTGVAIANVKRPQFFAFDDFHADRCNVHFHFILAQSIFSHAGPNLIATALASFKACLAETGVIAATFIHPKHTGGREDHADGWLYPGCMSYAPTTIQRLLTASGLVGRSLPWFHPRQTWYALAHDRAHLPPFSFDVHLSGAIWNTAEWSDSLRAAADPSAN